MNMDVGPACWNIACDCLCSTSPRKGSWRGSHSERNYKPGLYLNVHTIPYPLIYNEVLRYIFYTVVSSALILLVIQTHCSLLLVVGQDLELLHVEFFTFCYISDCLLLSLDYCKALWSILSTWPLWWPSLPTSKMHWEKFWVHYFYVCGHSETNAILRDHYVI